MDITWGASAAHEVAWGGMIAVYLFLAGIAGGAFITAAWADVWSKNRQEKIVRSGAYIAPISIIVGLVLLVFDLGRPFTFWKLLFNVNFGSVMSIGVFIISVFSALAVIYAYLVWSEASASRQNQRIESFGEVAAASYGRETNSLRKPIALLGGLAALGTATYTGFLLSAVSTNLLWHTVIGGIPFLPILFLISALSTGLAATLIGARDCSDLDGYKKADIVLIAIEIVLLGILYGTVNTAFFAGSVGALFWFGVIIIGLLLPLILSIYGVSKHKNLVLPVCSLVVIGGLCLRYFIVYAGQMVK